MNKTVILLATISLVGCVQATANEPSICNAQSMSWSMPTIPPVPTNDIKWVNGACQLLSKTYAVPTIPPITQSTTVDFSDAINQVTQNLDSYTINLTQLALDDLSVTNFGDWASVDVVATMSVANEVGSSLPPHTCSYSIPNGQVTTLTFDPGMSADEIVRYFSSGPVTLSFTLNVKLNDACGAAQYVEAFSKQKTLAASADVCVSASGSVSKSL